MQLRTESPVYNHRRTQDPGIILALEHGKNAELFTGTNPQKWEGRGVLTALPQASEGAAERFMQPRVLWQIVLGPFPFLGGLCGAAVHREGLGKKGGLAECSTSYFW